MKVLSTFFAIAALLLMLVAEVSAQSFDYRRTIEVINADSSPQSNVPVPVLLETAQGFNFANANADGSDVRFSTDDSAATLDLDYYIEYWVPAMGIALIWVNVPSVPANPDTVDIYMFYGDSGLTTSTEDFEATFPSRYVSTNNDTLSGPQTFDWFEIETGDTVFVDAGSVMEIRARRIIIDGVLNANAAGFDGGLVGTDGDGPGAGLTGGAGGGGSVGASGAGYGGDGGDGGYNAGQTPVAGGSAYNAFPSPALGVEMGSGGGGGSNLGGDGGGGLDIRGTLVSMEGGIIHADAAAGLAGNLGAGGGSGGGVLLGGYQLVLAGGGISANGGNGGDGAGGQPRGGGGGGGGRIQLVYKFGEDVTAFNLFVTPGTGGLGGTGDPGQPGQAGVATGPTQNADVITDEVVSDVGPEVPFGSAPQLTVSLDGMPVTSGANIEVDLDATLASLNLSIGATDPNSLDVEIETSITNLTGQGFDIPGEWETAPTANPQLNPDTGTFNEAVTHQVTITATNTDSFEDELTFNFVVLSTPELTVTVDGTQVDPSETIEVPNGTALADLDVVIAVDDPGGLDADVATTISNVTTQGFDIPGEWEVGPISNPQLTPTTGTFDENVTHEVTITTTNTGGREDSLSFSFVVVSGPTLTVTVDGNEVSQDDTIELATDTTLASLNVVITASDLAITDLEIETSISNVSTQGFDVAGEWETAPVANPELTPSTGSFSENVIHEVTITAINGLSEQDSLTFYFFVGPRIEVQRDSDVIDDGSVDTLTEVVPETGSLQVEYTVGNVGQGPLELTGTPLVEVIGSTNAQAFIVQQPESSIAASTTSEFSLLVFPDSAGTFEVMLRIEHNAAEDAPFEFTVEGVADPSAVLALIDPMERERIAGERHFIGYLRSYSAQEFDYTIRNDGSETLELDDPSVTVDNVVNASVEVSAQPGTLVLGTSDETTFTLLIEPVPSGPFSFTLTIASDDPQNPAFVAHVEGWATTLPQSRPQLERPTTIEIPHRGTHQAGYAESGTPQVYTFTARNIGVEPLNVEEVVASEAENADVTVTPLGTGELEYGETTTFDVEVTPLADGPWEVTLTLMNDSPMLPSYWVQVTGTGVASARPAIAVQRSGHPAVEAGGTDLVGAHPAGEAAVLVYWVRNTGTEPLNVEWPVTITGADNVNTSVVRMPDVLVAPVDGATPLVLRVTPQSAGVFSFTVNVESDDPDTPTFTFTVQGNDPVPGLPSFNKFMGGCAATATGQSMPLLLLLSLASLALLALARRRG